MNIERQQQVFDETVEEMRRIMFAKGNDYANEDRLSNFKLAGSISGGSAETNCLNLIATKVARLGVLLNSDATPNNESIDDTLVDLANYAVLLKMIREDGTACIPTTWSGTPVPIRWSNTPSEAMKFIPASPFNTPYTPYGTSGTSPYI